ncbi:Penicillin-binding protein 1B [Candidatus Ecksteinia adelgidicola]|nr:Penicillin-binding protein 1B [Candidatus Ecksteinia adelgidicola]
MKKNNNKILKYINMLLKNKSNIFYYFYKWIKKKCLNYYDTLIKNKKLINRKTKIIFYYLKYQWINLIIKFILIISTFLIVYGIYLDSQIRTRINNKVWHLPAEIYSRIVHLEPGMSYSKKEMINLLKSINYHQVKQINYPGEFFVQHNNIYILRRSFNFPNGKEEEIYVCMTFNNNTLVKIKNMKNQKNFKFFRLDPYLITIFQSPNNEQRLFVPLKKFPNRLIKTLISIEDRKFYVHYGVNPYSICRAGLINLSFGHIVQGGSTLTQQLVKNLFLTKKRSFCRKIKEVYMALLLNYHYSKNYILELYLNEVYLGQNGKNKIHGFPLASLYYFGRPINELSLDQQALLVGMVKGASFYNPYRHYAAALERRNVVLRVLRIQGIIHSKQYNRLITRPLNIQLKKNIISRLFISKIVKQELEVKLKRNTSQLSDIKIFTTLDLVSQNAAEKALKTNIVKMNPRYIKDLKLIMIVVDRFNGEVRAIVNNADMQLTFLKKTVKKHQSSNSLSQLTIKNTLYYPETYLLNTQILDVPLSFNKLNKKVFLKINYYNKILNHQLMLVHKFSKSLYTPKKDLALSSKLTNINNMSHHLDITPNKKINLVPSTLLKIINLKPLVEKAQEYQTIASGGQYAPISVMRSVMDNNSRLIYDKTPQSERVISEKAAYLALYAMKKEFINQSSSLFIKFPNYSLIGKNNNVKNLYNTWLTGIDGKEVVITFVDYHNNNFDKLINISSASTLYDYYLKYKTSLPLVLRKPKTWIK